jgi:hypothetical protein
MVRTNRQGVQKNARHHNNFPQWSSSGVSLHATRIDNSWCRSPYVIMTKAPHTIKMGSTTITTPTRTLDSTRTVSTTAYFADMMTPIRTVSRLTNSA